nr:hypothetical protein [Tanacetum cinerariifolium]
ELGAQKIITNGEPWVIMGDFNVTLKVEEHSNGSSAPSNEMNKQDYMRVAAGRYFFRVVSRGNPQCKTLKKLDRIMISEAFMDKFHASSGMFLPYMISNHSPTVLKIPNEMAKKSKAFRFSNFVTDKREFIPIVKKAWEAEVDGHMIVTKFRECLKEVQAEVDKHPHNEDIKAKSCKIPSEYYDAMKDENNIMHKGSIMSVCNEKGERFENDKVAEQFVIHFQKFIGKKDVVTEMPIERIVLPNKLNREEVNKMCRGVSEVEVKNAMFDIEDSKAPGPDGLTARFYKSSWSIIGKDICKAVHDFFVTGKLLGEELFKGYNRKQVDFPKKMVEWIMVCVSTTKFSININGEREGYFSGGRGLRLLGFNKLGNQFRHEYAVEWI